MSETHFWAMLLAFLKSLSVEPSGLINPAKDLRERVGGRVGGRVD